MGFYRQSRNLEYSLIKYLESKFEDENWTNITVEKTFNAAYTQALKMETGSSVICVRASNTNRSRIEIGTNNLIRKQLVLIDVFATSDGQRLDLVDFIVDSLKDGFPYIEVKTDKANIDIETENGQVTIMSIDDNPVNFNVDKSSLELQDRYRHLISIVLSTGKVE